jgi:hypothetical protein
MLRFYPHRKAKKMRLEKYREAWHYLDPTDPSRRPPITIHAVADETFYPEPIYPEPIVIEDFVTWAQSPQPSAISRDVILL